MTVRMSTANIITLSRLPLLILVVVLLYLPWAWALFSALALLPILYLMDWFDGYVARHKNQVTDLGSVLDIAIDRVVENVLWIVFAHQHKIPVWIRRLVTMVPSLIVIFIGLEPTRTLVISQVLLSFGLPFAIIPLIIFTSRRSLMGELVNKRITNIAILLIAAIIIALNIFLLYQTIFGG